MYMQVAGERNVNLVSALVMLTLALSRQPKVKYTGILKATSSIPYYSENNEKYNEPGASALNIQLLVVLVPSLNNTILEQCGNGTHMAHNQRLLQ